MQRKLAIGCVIGAAILAVFVLMIANRVNAAKERSAQNRSLTDLQTLGITAHLYACDKGAYPNAADLDQFVAIVEPEYAKNLPRTDAWGTRYRYACWRENPSSAGCDRFAVISAGSDRQFEHQEPRMYAKRRSDEADGDLVYSEGVFVKAPPHFPDYLEPEEVWSALQKGEIVVADLRDHEEYRVGHIAKAINLPGDEIAGRAGEIAPGVRVVVYGVSVCESHGWKEWEAARDLGRAGRKAFLLQGGIDRWRKLGLPIER